MTTIESNASHPENCINANSIHLDRAHLTEMAKQKNIRFTLELQQEKCTQYTFQPRVTIVDADGTESLFAINFEDFFDIADEDARMATLKKALVQRKSRTNLYQIGFAKQAKLRIYIKQDPKEVSEAEADIRDGQQPWEPEYKIHVELTIGDRRYVSTTVVDPSMIEQYIVADPPPDPFETSHSPVVRICTKCRNVRKEDALHAGPGRTICSCC